MCVHPPPAHTLYTSTFGPSPAVAVAVGVTPVRVLPHSTRQWGQQAPSIASWHPRCFCPIMWAQPGLEWHRAAPHAVRQLEPLRLSGARLWVTAEMAPAA